MAKLSGADRQLVCEKFMRDVSSSCKTLPNNKQYIMDAIIKIDGLMETHISELTATMPLEVISSTEFFEQVMLISEVLQKRLEVLSNG